MRNMSIKTGTWLCKKTQWLSTFIISDKEEKRSHFTLLDLYKSAQYGDRDRIQGNHMSFVSDMFPIKLGFIFIFLKCVESFQSMTERGWESTLVVWRSVCVHMTAFNPLMFQM